MTFLCAVEQKTFFYGDQLRWNRKIFDRSWAKLVDIFGKFKQLYAQNKQF